MRVDVTVTNGESTNFGIHILADGNGPVQLTLRTNGRSHTALLSAGDAHRLARALDLAAEATPPGPIEIDDTWT